MSAISHEVFMQTLAKPQPTGDEAYNNHSELSGLSFLLVHPQTSPEALVHPPEVHIDDG